MSKENRQKIIAALQQKRDSIVISYVTSTRPNLELPMTMDIVRRIYDHLSLLKVEADHKPKIDLFIHSNGGDATMPWPLVTLIREFTDFFSVLVPHRAYSAATLTALGADAIVMHPMGVLGPTDQTVTTGYTPTHPHTGQRLGIAAEDVTAFIALIKEDVGIRHEDELALVFNKMADQVHPLALGHVKRTLAQSRMVARKLLSLHMDPRESQRINDIVDNLNSRFFNHGHPINRTEAKEQVGISTIRRPPSDVEDLMWKLYLEYEREIKMEIPFDYEDEFRLAFPFLAPEAPAEPATAPADPAQPAEKPLASVYNVTPLSTAKLGYVESFLRTDVHLYSYEVSGKKLENGLLDCNLLVRGQGWVEE